MNMNTNVQQKKVYLVTEITPEQSRVGEKMEEGRSKMVDADDHSPEPQTGMAAEKAVGALCYLPKSIHRLASRAAEDRDLTAKRFFFETIVNSLHQQGIITDEQRAEALRLPNEYGWKGRNSSNR